jgi:hypothetical protein
MISLELALVFTALCFAFIYIYLRSIRMYSGNAILTSAIICQVILISIFPPHYINTHRSIDTLTFIYILTMYMVPVACVIGFVVHSFRHLEPHYNECLRFLDKIENGE